MKEHERRKPYVQFKASRTIPRGDFRKQELQKLITIRALEVGKEPFVDYGEKSII